MRFWVDKEQEKKPDGEWKDAYVFSINRKQYSTIFTNITNSWYRMDQMQIPAIYEDLFIIGLSIFALDKRVSRRRFKNCWTITNFFAYNTKREIVGQVKDTDAFKSCYADTISCSHPCLARYNKKGSKEYPVNCGYCYPCLIRKSSLLDIDEIKKYSYQGEAYDFLIEYEESEKSADLRAVLGSIYRCKHSSDKELKRYIRCVGELTEEEVEKFLSLYKKSIEDLVQLFSADQRMKEYLGL